MQKVTKMSCLLALLLSIIIVSCSDSNNPDPKPAIPVLKMTVDKSIIKADGIEQAKFSVTIDGSEIKKTVTIFPKGDSIALQGMSFSTEQAGSYTFYAMYDEQKSNEISVEATEAGVLLTADKTTIKANNKDATTFNVTYNGQNITSSAIITLTGTTDSILKESVFSIKQAG